jgi:hypothetical protein
MSRYDDWSDALSYYFNRREGRLPRTEQNALVQTAANEPLTYEMLREAADSLSTQQSEISWSIFDDVETTDASTDVASNIREAYRTYTIDMTAPTPEYRIDPIYHSYIDTYRQEYLLPKNKGEHMSEETTEQSQEEQNINWSQARTKHLRFDNNVIIEQIRTRYALLDRPTNGLSNIIIDNYAPKLFYMSKLDPARLVDYNLPKTAYAISPWFADFFGVQQISTEQLCRILGYSVKDIKTLITKVKRNDYSISFVGYGGTGVNTIHWLTELMKMTQSVNLFKFIEVYEPDWLEISNLLRFPKHPYMEYNTSGRWVHSSSKLRLLSPTELKLLSKNKPGIFTERINGQNLPYRSNATYYDYSQHRNVVKDKHIFYGAPDIGTRSSFDGHFISATHNGNDAHLWLNPTQDSDLQVESYGLIELTPFFMNQLSLAIGLLEVLSTGDLALNAQDTLLKQYSFDGTPKLSTNRVYNFQLNQHNGLVATEEQAAVW